MQPNKYTIILKINGCKNLSNSVRTWSLPLDASDINQLAKQPFVSNFKF